MCQLRRMLYFTQLSALFQKEGRILNLVRTKWEKSFIDFHKQGRVQNRLVKIRVRRLTVFWYQFFRTGYWGMTRKREIRLIGRMRRFSRQNPPRCQRKHC